MLSLNTEKNTECTAKQNSANHTNTTAHRPNRHINEPVNQISSIFKTKKSDQSECTKISGKWRRRDRRTATSPDTNYFGHRRENEL